jgi:hypothetical protein
VVRRFPVQQHAVCLDPSERHQRRDGDFEAQKVDELFDGLREDPVGTEGHPIHMLTAIRHPVLGEVTHQKRASSTKAVFIQPEDRKTRASML